MFELVVLLCTVPMGGDVTCASTYKDEAACYEFADKFVNDWNEARLGIGDLKGMIFNYYCQPARHWRSEEIQND